MSKATEVTLKLNTGASFPALGLGTANDKQNPLTKEAVIAAVEAGYRHIDTAWVYGSEPYIGEALKELFARGVVKREDLFITTKVWPTHWDIPQQSLEESLERLGVEYVDLLLQHWPAAFNRNYDENGQVIGRFMKDGKFDVNPAGSYIEGYKKLEKLYKEDQRIKAIGVSNYNIAYFEQLFANSEVIPAVNQIELHPALPQTELVEYCKSKGIVVTAYSPLGSDGAPLTKIAPVQQLAEKYATSPGEVLTSYHITQGRAVIPRSVKPARIRATTGLVPLTDSEVAALNEYGLENPQRFIVPNMAVLLPGFSGW